MVGVTIIYTNCPGWLVLQPYIFRCFKKVFFFLNFVVYFEFPGIVVVIFDFCGIF